MIAMIAMCEFRCLDMACPDEDVVNCVMFLLCIDFCIRTQLGQNGSSPFWSVLVRFGPFRFQELEALAALQGITREELYVEVPLGRLGECLKAKHHRNNMETYGNIWNME